MATASLDDLTAFNEQLAALLDAGVKLDVGLATSGTSTDRALERINSTVARRVARGESLSDALESDDDDIPPAYRSLTQFGLATGSLPEGLDESNRVAESVDESRFALESALIYPLIVCCVVYFGLIGMCLFLLPTWEEMYESLRVPPGTGVRVLRVVRDALPLWATALPALLFLLFAWRFGARWRRKAHGVEPAGLMSHLPGVSQTIFQQRCARFADSLEDMLRRGTPLDAALEIAADGSGDDNLRDGGRSLAEAVRHGKLPADDSPTARLFPPFLRWALLHSEATTGRERALEIATTIYRDSAARRSERLRTLAPIVILVLVGGTVTLLYGMALFVPFVEMLHTIAGTSAPN
jgi:type II secretory pathway component PulF